MGYMSSAGCGGGGRAARATGQTTRRGREGGRREGDDENGRGRGVAADTGHWQLLYGRSYGHTSHAAADITQNLAFSGSSASPAAHTRASAQRSSAGRRAHSVQTVLFSCARPS